MEEYYPFIWFMLFMCWLFISAFLILTAEDAQKGFNKLIQHNNTVLNKYKHNNYVKETIKSIVLDINDSNCNCGDSWTVCLSHSEF